MAAAVTFTPLYGVHSEEPLSYIMEVDEVCILLDCGWTDDYDVLLLEPLKKVVDKIDLVLISHSDIMHLGALPYAVGKLGLKAPIYSTLPVHKMGQLTMYDAYQSRANYEDFTIFTLDDVDAAFDMFKTLKYSEKLTLTSRGEGIIITPHAAGHRIGGAFWKIAKETDEIVYAVDYNHRAEHHLPKAGLSELTRPSLLITDAYSMQQQQLKRKTRDTMLFDNVIETIRRGGNVLIPCDTAGRCLEILLILQVRWTESRLRDPLCLLHNTSSTTIEAAKAMLEWCSENISKQFDTTRNNPFEFNNVHLLHSMDDLNNLPSPKVVLASSPSMQCGFSRELFMQWAPDSKNKIIVPDRSTPSSLARQIMQSPKPTEIKLTWSMKVPLEGAELAAVEAKERRRLQEEVEARAAAEEEAAMEDMMAGIDEDSEDEGEGVKAKPAQLMGTFRVGLGKFSTPHYPLFSAREVKLQWDEYGEVINPDDYRDQYSKADNARKVRRELGTQDVPDPMEVSGEPPADVNRPMKVLTKQATVHVNCDVMYLDFEGRCDGKAMKNLLSTVKPRKLIIVHGPEEGTKELKDFAESRLENCSKVFAPRPGDYIDIESDTSVLKLKLGDSLYQALDFQQVGAYEVAYVEAELQMPKEDSSMPVLELEEGNLINGVIGGGHPSLLLREGELKLSLLRDKIAKAGYEAEIKGGILLCKNGLAIRKTKGDEVVLEGPLCEEYFKLRDILYEEYNFLI